MRRPPRNHLSPVSVVAKKLDNAFHAHLVSPDVFPVIVSACGQSQCRFQFAHAAALSLRQFADALCHFAHFIRRELSGIDTAFFEVAANLLVCVDVDEAKHEPRGVACQLVAKTFDLRGDVGRTYGHAGSIVYDSWQLRPLRAHEPKPQSLSALRFLAMAYDFILLRPYFG